MAAKKKQPTYTEAATELETILDAIESGDADVDVLGEKVERAAELIKFCREKLTGTEQRVDKVVADLRQLEDGGEAAAEVDDEDLDAANAAAEAASEDDLDRDTPF
jgi:exodeoxyribonuclease VII small subunit